MTDKLLEYFNGDDFAASTWENKYALRKDGEPIEETPAFMHRRMAKEFARIEAKYDGAMPSNVSPHYKKRKRLTQGRIFDLFDHFKYIIPAGSVMAGLGAEKPVSLSNCFVLPSPEDSYTSIMDTRKMQVEMMKRRGGVGYDLSKLRPRGAFVNNAAVTSTGAASFMDGNSDITNEVSQNGRRGALMMSIDVRHPDSEEFVMKKQDLTKVTGANVSVQVTDDFMRAAELDADYILRWPVDSCPHLIEVDDHAVLFDVENYDKLEYGKLYRCRYLANEFMSRYEDGWGYVKKIKAKELWDKVIHCAWNTAEPGIIFKDAMHNFSPDGGYPQYKMVSTNPCFAGGTKILTESGYQTFRHIFNNGGVVNLIDENGNERQGEIWSNGFKHVIEVHFDDGVFIECTPEHRFKTLENDECEAKNLIGRIVKGFDSADKKCVKIVDNSNICEVFDFSLKEDDKNNTHWGVIEGMIAHNCGEIGMDGYNSCRLLAINMLSFVDNPFTEECTLNVDRVYDITYDAMRLCDDLVDLECEAVERIISNIKEGDDADEMWKEVLKRGRDTRRCGLEFTALSDMVAAMGLKFCTEEGNQFVDKVMRLMMSACLDCQVDMALERGVFPAYDEKCEDSNFWFRYIEQEYPERYARMDEFGRRNISFTTAGPTGSLSILTRTSSGIEPLFMPYYVRRRKCMTENDRVDYTDKMGINFSEFVIVHPQLKVWAKIHHPEIAEDIDNGGIKESKWKELYEESPWNGACAQDISWEKRVELQGIVQRNLVTHSISSTVNLPDNVTEKEVSNIYMHAWKNGLKGITVYRDGSREGILIQKEQKKEDDKFESYISAPKRPKTLEADFYTTKVKGMTFYVMVGLYKNKPYEIFVYRTGFEQEMKSIKNHKGTITKIKRGVYRYESELLTIDNINVHLSNEERATAIYTSMLMRHAAPLDCIIKTAQKVDDNITSFTAAMTRILKKYLKDEVIEGEVCPDCGGKLIRENGCIRCLDCGWSKCG